MSIETWKSLADWATIVLIAFTAVSGSAALVLGNRINKKQAERLRTFDRDLTDAKEELSLQQERAAKAEKQLESVKKDVDRGTAEAKREAEELRGQNLVTETKLEEERQKTAELQKLNVPRILGFLSVDGKTNLDSLKPFAGIQFIIQSVPESEPRSAARYIEAAVTDAGWKKIAPVPTSSTVANISPNVVVERYRSQNPAVGNRDEEYSYGAASALVQFLKDNGWDGRVADTSRGPVYAIPVNTVRILVGPKEAPGSFNPQVKRNEETIEKKMKESEEKYKEN